MSYIAWLDHSEHERRKMLDIIDLFREQNTVDELGIGGVRDAFADLMFPGTSTIQTRARYFLFVPWIYRALEAKAVPSAAVAARARREEVALIEALIAAGEKAGVIGVEARQSLKRLPSNVYWSGLAKWGLRRFIGPQDQYHRSLDRFYRLTGQETRNDDGEPVEGGLRRNWDPGLPSPPDGFPGGATLDLSSTEAEYLAGRIMSTHPASLLAALAHSEHSSEACAFPWQHPDRGAFVERHREQLHHAQLFSETAHGAPLLYNLMLAEKAKQEELVQAYQEELADWATTVEEQAANLSEWDQTQFWKIALSGGAKIGPRAQAFITRWLSLVLPPGAARSIVDNPKARQLVFERERALKGEQSRLTNQRALERWSGAAGTGQIDYRWGISQRILIDILQGRGVPGA